MYIKESKFGRLPGDVVRVLVNVVVALGDEDLAGLGESQRELVIKLICCLIDDTAENAHISARILADFTFLRNDLFI